MLKTFSAFLFTIMGWKMQGQIPAEIKKCIVVAAPHTSNYDLLLALAGFYKMKIPVRYLVKREWVNFFPLSRIFKASGALGVDRSKSNSLVDNLAAMITASSENMAVMISPEGTRKLVHKWKTGLYYAALKANVPIVLSSLDYAKKVAAIGPIFMPTGNYQEDMQILKNYYKDITPKYPELFSLEIYPLEEKIACTG
ncbi:MAG: 1-acyl-sn-glycerol-3-phosphate acyltransferase [Dethiobacteria bacterium]|nr:1-acyl-sn-glycerol-3-phosphate acyltransferase [Dethiobacteria bacterium]